MADPVIDSAVSLRKSGFAVHWLKPRSKSPIGNNWQAKPVMSVAQLQGSYRKGNNIGVRLGSPSIVYNEFLHCLDLDIRDEACAEEAHDALLRLLPNAESLPCVASGSGGQSRHFYFTTSEAFRSRKLARSEDEIVDAAGKHHWKWEIELFGTGKQVVLPPSIHPCGRPYAWVREFDDFDPPTVSSKLVRKWGVSASADEDSDDLEAELRRQPLDMTDDEVWEVLNTLPLATWCVDRDGWYKVGMVLHHQYEGSAHGFNIWCKFSQQSEKFNLADSKRVWSSFNTKREGEVVRMPTLIAAANEEKISAELEGAGDDVDEFDLDDEDKPKKGWTKLLQHRDGKVLPTFPNLVHIVSNDVRIRGVLAHNSFIGRPVRRKVPGIYKRPGAKFDSVQLNRVSWNLEDPLNGDLWSDTNRDELRLVLETQTNQGGYGLPSIAKRDLEEATNIVSKANSFHPVREYLSALKWDGRKRLDDVFIRYLGCEDNAYIRKVTHDVWLAAAMRVFNPGAKFDFVPIFEGNQGLGKSTFIKTMGKHWGSYLPRVDSDMKKMIEAMMGTWIFEIPELQGMNKAEVQNIKAFFSGTTDHTRLSYDRYVTKFHRQCIFMGTTNDEDYLRDKTGNRRFWPIKCADKEIDMKSFEAEVDQIWAEVMVEHAAYSERYGRGNWPLYMNTPELRAYAEEEQQKRVIESYEDEVRRELEAWLDLPVPLADLQPNDVFASHERDNPDARTLVRRVCVCAKEIREQFFTKGDFQNNNIMSATIGRIMLSLPGWERTRNAHSYGFSSRQRGFVRKGCDENVRYELVGAVDADEFDL